MREEIRAQFSVGKRIIKTALAAGIAYFIAYFFNLQSVFMASVVAIICMQPTIHETLTVSRNRALASVIGSVIALLFFHIHDHNPFLIALGIGIMLYICKIFKWKDASAISGVIFVSIYSAIPDPSIFHVALDRLLSTFIGITASFIINYIIPPTYIHNAIKAEFKKLLVLDLKLLRIALDMVYKNISDLTEFNLAKTEFVEHFDSANKNYKTFKNEAQYMKKEDSAALEQVGDVIDSFSVSAMYTTQIALDLKASPLPPLTDDYRYALFHLIGMLDNLSEDYDKIDLNALIKSLDDTAADLRKTAIESQENYSVEDNARIFNIALDLQQISAAMEQLTR